MMTTVLCYSAILGIDAADYDTSCRVDMGNVGLLVASLIPRAWAVTNLCRRGLIGGSKSWTLRKS